MLVMAKCYWNKYGSRMELGKVKHEYGSGPAEIPHAPAGQEILHSLRKKLGIRSSLKSDDDLVALVEERLPVGAISALMEHGILEKEIYSVIVPRRTLQHRRARKENLSREESDRAVRLARLAALTEKNSFCGRDG